MNRWRGALMVLWRSEPALPLVLYLLLAAAQVALIQLGGAKLDHSLPAKYGTYLALIPYAFGAWRIWLGGYIAWTLSVLWRMIGIGVAALSAYHHPGLLIVAVLVLSLASTAVLFSEPILHRTERRGRTSPRTRPVSS